MKRVLVFLGLVVGLIYSQAQVRFVEVDPTNNAFTIKNFGNNTVDISTYRLCSEFRYTSSPLTTLSIDAGSLNLTMGASVTISGWDINATAADFGLYLPTGGFGSASAMVDFLQWGAAGIGRESVAATKGIWTAGEFIEGNAPYTYTGDGTENGAASWQVTEDMPAYVAKLSGSQQVQPVLSDGWGNIYAEIENDSLSVWGAFGNLIGNFEPAIAGGSHIHTAYAGQNGGPAFFLVPTLDDDLKGGTYEKANNKFPISAAQKTALMNRGMYVNIHTTAYMSGEIRGQILPNSDAYYMANLFGGNQTPSIMTTASGALALELSGDELVVTGSFMNMEGKFNSSIGQTGVHLHAGLAGENGSPSIFLNVTTTDSINGVFEASNNTFTLTPEQKELLATRNLYANLHSTKYGTGELRGQVGGWAKARFRAHLSGANEAPPIVSEATGELLLELIDSNLVVSGTFQNLEGDLATDIAGGAHLHLGFAGVNGGPVFPLNVTMDGNMRNGRFKAADNVFTLDSAQKAMLFQRKLYVNIHSQKNLPGELRGQVLAEGMFVLNGFLSGTNQAPPIASPAYGAVKAEVLGNKLTITGAFDNLGSDMSGAHLHLAPAGSNGGVAIPLEVSLKDGNNGGYFDAANNSYDISDGMIDTLRSRYAYLNIHSMDIGSGELRGQLLGEATAYFTAPLSGTSQIPAVKTTATGALIAEYVNGKMWVSGSFNALESDYNPNVAGGAHIHTGLAGQVGPPVFFLTPTLGDDNRSGKFAIGENVFEASSGQVDSLRKRMFYVNLHSMNIPSGEIRGNLLPQATAYFTTSMRGKNQVQPIESSGLGALKVELSGNQLTLSGSFTGLNGQYNANVAGGSHLHAAGPASNGSISVFLNPSFPDTSLRSGIYWADSNTYTLDEAQLADVWAGNLYINLHSTSVMSGELRGQILAESNFYPTDEATITAPTDGAVMEISGDPATPFITSWSEATDPNGNTLAYSWQLGIDEQFLFKLINANVGSSTQFATTFGNVDSLLVLAGVATGDTITFYHRAVASDGSVCSTGPAYSIKFIRGIVTDIDDDLLNEFRVQLFPSPVKDVAKLTIQAPQTMQVDIRIIDLLARVVDRRETLLRQGENQLIFNFNNYRAGMYIIQISYENQGLKTLKILKN